MKCRALYFTGIAMVASAAPAAADIIYGSLQQTITTDYTGVTVTVGDGTLNPFFGGAGVANNNNLQPFRLAATGLSTIKGFATGVFINSGSGSLATGAGGSIDHLGAGGTFTAGTEGYVGFKLDGANYGWMRVVLTNNTSTPVTPVVKDWAYDTTGAAIKTGWINTDVVSGTAQTATLNPDTGESFTLASALANASGSITNSVVKTGAGTAALTVASTYSGDTTLSNGVLLVNNTSGSGTGSGSVNVTGGKLGGSGTISGAVTIGAAGTLAPTAQASGSKLALGSTVGFTSGSIFEWTLNATTTDPGAGTSNSGTYGQVAATGAASGNAVFNIVLGSNAYTNAFWDTNKSWNNVFSASGLSDLSTVFTTFSGSGLTASGSGATAIATAPGQGSFSFSGGTTLTWTAVPEPGSALAGILLGAGLLRRRREPVGTSGPALPSHTKS